MLDEYVNEILTLLGVGVSGTSIVTLICMIIYVVKAIAKVYKTAKDDNASLTEQLNSVIEELQNQITAIQESTKTTSEQIEESFQEAVLPKTIRLDLSSKVTSALESCTTEITEEVDDTLKTVMENQVLILKILSQFTHVQKLSEEDQEAIAYAISDKSTEVEVTVPDEKIEEA